MNPRMIVLALLLSLLCAGCVTAVDPDLPYASLPEIELATDVNLVASPSHPTAYLPGDAISAGQTVQLIGSDTDGAYLLVLHEDRLGWMPSIFSRSNVATLPSAVAFDPPVEECSRLLDTTFDIGEEWVSMVNGPVQIIGSILRPQAAEDFDNAILALEIDGRGHPITSDYVHTSLTKSSSLVLFGYSVHDLDKGSRVSFAIDERGKEPLIFQVAFFSNECPAEIAQLSIGKSRVPQAGENVGVVQTSEQPEVPSAEPTGGSAPVVIEKKSGPLSFVENDVALSVCSSESNCDIHIRGHDQESIIQVTEDPAIDQMVSWSPDGSQFVFVSNRTGVEQLYIYDMAEKRFIRQLTDSPDRTIFPAWSPDGQEIAYQEWNDDAWHIWKVNLETMERKRLTTSGTHKTAQWSPDGSKIVMSAARRDTNSDGRTDDDDDRHIFVMNTDGSGIKAVTSSADFYDQVPSWMPDAEHIIFIRRVNGRTVNDLGPGEIYLVNVTSRATEALTFSSADELWPVPSPAGNAILFVVRKDQGDPKTYAATWNGQTLGRPVFLADGDVPAWRPSPHDP